MDSKVGGPDTLHLTLTNDIREIAALRDAADTFAIRFRFSPTRRLDLQLVLEETVANVICHAWDGGRHVFEVRLTHVGEVIVAEVEDDGRPFDPLSLAPFDDAPLERRRCGGMGVHLIRQLTDELTYERIGGRNRLRMTLNPRSANEPDAS